MEQQMDFSAELGALAKALAKAQASVTNATKDATNPHFKNRYATLASVRAAITGPLSESGLAVVQTTEPHGDAGVCVVTMLVHESGQWVRGRLFLPVAKKDPQSFGAAISYGRRFALGAIVGIATEDDDDGAQASTPAPAVRRVEPPQASGVDVAPLLEALRAAKTAGELAKATAEVGKVKSKLSPADHKRCKDEYRIAEQRLTGEERKAS